MEAVDTDHYTNDQHPRQCSEWNATSYPLHKFIVLIFDLMQQAPTNAGRQVSLLFSVHVHYCVKAEGQSCGNDAWDMDTLFQDSSDDARSAPRLPIMAGDLD